MGKYDCTFGSPSRWSQDKSSWCNSHGGKYDCLQGTASSWSQDKFDSCCILKGIGCPASTGLGFSADQLAEDDARRNDWEDEAALDRLKSNQDYHRFNNSFDCLHMKQNDTSQKKKWCCSRWGLGCPKASVTDDIGFDCEAGLWNWQKGWSVKKKTWCCKHRSKGCVGTAKTAAVRALEDNAMKPDRMSKSSLLAGETGAASSPLRWTVLVVVGAMLIGAFAAAVSYVRGQPSTIEECSEELQAFSRI